MNTNTHLKKGIVEMFLKRGLPVIMVVLLASMALSPLAVFAAETGDVSGQFSVGQPPMVDSVSLTQTSMVPQTSYTVAVQVSDTDTLANLTTVALKVWYDSNGGTPLQTEYDAATANTQTCAVITWTNGSGFAISSGASTTWALGACTAPTLTNTTGSFSFVFTPGKVAYETPTTDKWQLAAKATDASAGTGWNCDAEGAAMNWYGQITVPTSTAVNWGTLVGGTDFASTSKAVSATINFVANGDYAEHVRSTATWAGISSNATLDAGGTCGTAQQFALKADDTSTLTTAVLLGTTGTPIDNGNRTGETGLNETGMNLWMKLASTFAVDTYQGTITYSIVNN
jgi:hypothetical protein